MARVIQKTKSKQGKEIKCGRAGCGAVIQPGEKYFSWTPFRQGTRVRCHLHSPRQSELDTTKLSAVYAANESIEDEIEKLRAGKSSIQDLANTVDSAADDVEGVRDEYQESLDNMGENLAQGDTGQAMQEKVEGLDSYADTLRNAKDEIEALVDSADDTEGEDSDKAETEEDGIESAATLAEDAVGEFSL